MTMHKITDFYTVWFSVCPNIISIFRTITTIKNLIKYNNDSNKTCRYAHNLSLFQTSFV
jgi:hypothetical protein